MAKPQIAIFTTNNCRILKGHAPADVKCWPNVVVNPDLSGVSGLPPHYWKQGSGKKILAMSTREKKDRDAHIHKHGVDNHLGPIIMKERHPLNLLKNYKSVATWAAAGAALVELVHVLAHVFG